MIRATTLGFGCLVLAGLGGCGSSASPPDGGAVTEAGICGTTAQPGRLNLANLTPATGSSVANQNILHGFTVVGAPAEFNNFELRFGPSHTAGPPIPENPKFTMTTVGSDIIYQLTIEAWSNAPAHVELVASGGYQTKQGCAWSFPSPLFFYDLVAGPDGGSAREAGGASDGRTQTIDTPRVFYNLDTAMKLDLANDEPGLDIGARRESGAGLDGVTAAIDAALDSADDKAALDD